MWNSPSNRDLILQPKDLFSLCLDIDCATDMDFLIPINAFTQAPYYVSKPFRKLPPGVLCYESFRLMHTLVTDTPVPDGGHTALEESLLYDLLSYTLSVGIDFSNDSEEAAKPYVSTINNLLRRAGSRKRVKAPIKIDIEYWENDVLDKLFFWDRDWELADPEMLQSPQSPALLERLGISASYYNQVQLPIPTKRQLMDAHKVFLEIYDCASKGTKIPKALKNIPALVKPVPPSAAST